MTTKGQVSARPQSKEASKQAAVTLKRHAEALVLKLRKRAKMTMMGHVGACPLTMDASKEADVTSKRHAKVLVLKIMK